MFTIKQKESKHVDWSGPLRSYLARNYGSTTDFGPDAAAFQTLRQDALGASANSGGRDILYRYYVQLENLGLRIPVNESGCKISFSWKDLFSSTEISQYSLAFEKAAILFNLASVLFTIGIESESSKTGFAAFQAAAGIYKMISENFIHAPSPDFEADTTKTLLSLAMAHAQALFISTTIEKAPSSLLFSLAQGAATLYKEAKEGLETLYSSKSWGEKAWAPQIGFAARYWDAFSHHHYALHLDQKGEHGAAIAYMREAKSLFGKITEQYTTKFASAKDVQAYCELSATKLRNMDKDNDLLYHLTIPPISGSIAHKIAVKPLEIDKIMSPEEMERVIGRELFSNVVPMEVHEIASMYSEELAKVARQQKELSDVADQELKSALDYLDLPRSARLLEAESQGSTSAAGSSSADVPTAVLEWSRELNCSAPLALDFSKRAQTLALVDTFSDSARPQGQKIKASIVQASSQDETLRAQYAKIQPDLARLSDTRGLEREFAAGPSAQPSLLDFEPEDRTQVTAQIHQVLDIYEKLLKVEKERKIVLNELRQRLFNDDIKSQLVAHRKTQKPEQIFEAEKEKFAPFIGRIQSTRSRQRSLLAELTSVWKQVLANPQVKREAAARQQKNQQSQALVDKYRATYQTWLGLVEGAAQANSFYDQLLRQAQQVHGRSLPLDNMGSLQNALDVSAYSVPSTFSSSLYDRPPPPAPR